MTRVSRRPIQKDLEERMFQIFRQSFADLKNEKDVFEFLEDLLSPAEKIMLAKRLAVAVMLEKGWGFELISSTLKVSTATVNSIRQKKSLLGKGFNKVILNILKKEELTTFLETIAVSFTSAVAPIRKVGLSASFRKLAKNYQIQQNRKKKFL